MGLAATLGLQSEDGGAGEDRLAGEAGLVSSELVIMADGVSHRFAIEMAVSEQERNQGLMFRRELAADAGMLFDYGTDRPVAFWMKNTYIPLDMLFIKASGEIVHIAERTVPLSLQSIPSPEPVRAVLEVNAGTVARLGIVPGHRVRHPIFAAATE